MDHGAGVQIKAIILSDHMPVQSARLVDRLDQCGIVSHVHVNALRDLSPFEDAFAARDACFITDRVPVRWGGYSVIRATLALIQAARKDGFDRLLLLPEDAYPIKSPEQIQSVLADHGNQVDRHLIDPQSDLFGRISQTFLLDFPAGAVHGGRADLDRFVDAGLAARLGAVQASVRMKRDAVFPWPYAKGAQSWCLDAPTVDRMMSFLVAVPAFAEWFAFSSMPEEAFFQTLAGIIGDESILNTSPVHTEWGRNPSPFVYSDPDDATALCALPQLFAAKFGADAAPLLDAIDAMTGQS